MAEVGADIESVCSKCGDVWHVVVAKVDGHIAKVLCKQCGKTYRYRSPKAKAKTVQRKRTRKSAEGTSPGSKILQSAEDGPRVPAGNGPVRDYGASQSFSISDSVNHIKFGVGVVEEVQENRITVYFDGAGRKTLVHAKHQAKLSRPKTSLVDIEAD